MAAPATEGGSAGAPNRRELVQDISARLTDLDQEQLRSVLHYVSMLGTAHPASGDPTEEQLQQTMQRCISKVDECLQMQAQHGDTAKQRRFTVTGDAAYGAPARTHPAPAQSALMQLNAARGELESTRRELGGMRGELGGMRGELESTRGDLDVLLTEIEHGATREAAQAADRPPPGSRAERVALVESLPRVFADAIREAHNLSVQRHALQEALSHYENVWGEDDDSRLGEPLPEHLQDADADTPLEAAPASAEASEAARTPQPGEMAAAGPCSGSLRLQAAVLAYRLRKARNPVLAAEPVVQK